ncbi:hypothetical protein Tco_0578122 [Tanacetum coccineum]
MEGGSLVDIIYEHCFNKLPEHTRSHLRPPTTLLIVVEFPTEAGVATVRSDYPGRDASLAAAIEEGNIREIAWKPIPGDTLKEHKVIINPEYPDQPIKIGSDLSPQVKNQLVQLLANSLDVLTQKPEDITRIPRELAEHNLGLNQYETPVGQKRRCLSLERFQAMEAQVTSLIKAGILHPVQYQTWVANPVLVKKHNGTWRMCVYFTNLNKACPKKNNPLPPID